MMWLAFITAIGYTLIILTLSLDGFLYKSFRKRPTDSLHDDESLDELLPFTIIVNYRNEADHLPEFLNSLSLLKYPKDHFEIFFINDASSDHSENIIREFEVHHPEWSIHLIDRTVKSASAKKDGITQAVALATHERIICTDADVVVPKNWLQAFNKLYHFHQDAHFIAGPVQITHTPSLITQIQHAEMVALQMVSIGAFSQRQPFMCNGANMSFTKLAFVTVNGYDGNDHISSGDDVFLLEKLAAEDVMNCHYLKSTDAIVRTHPKKDFKSMIHQRARWAQKGTKTRSNLNKLVSFQVLLMNVAFVFVPLLFLLGLVHLKILILIMLPKIIVDIIVLVVGHQFFEHKKWPLYVLPQLLIYPIVVIAVALKSTQKIQWSDRAIN